MSPTMVGVVGGEPLPLHPADDRIPSMRAPLTAAEMVQDLRERLDRQEEWLAEERGVSAALREAILPEPGANMDLPTARIAVRYAPAVQPRGDAAAPPCATLGGDWYEAATLPDGRVLLAVGDVSGHGMAAIAQMAQLRHALVGLAMTGRPPNRLLAWLNALVLNRLDDTIATVIVGLLDPATGLLTWAQAGHLAPIMVRDGRARQLRAPRGLVLGASPDPPFTVSKVRLRPGDLLLMFTDGLVERRDRDIDEGLELIMRAAEKIGHHDLDASLGFLIDAAGGLSPEDDTCLLAVGVLGR
ncbi:PP2C family protein-serine/threonine phosphatase [Acrocarpospora macrocephala]|nr:PP2C family protein-serine/threonine phosphatase [Acrocarpospora macrocephala]